MSSSQNQFCSPIKQVAKFNTGYCSGGCVLSRKL